MLKYYIMKQTLILFFSGILSFGAISSLGQAWTTSGSDLVTNSSTNNVGIHTTSPSADLQVIHLSGDICGGSGSYPFAPPALRLDDNYTVLTTPLSPGPPQSIFEIWHTGTVCGAGTPYTQKNLVRVRGWDATTDDGGDVDFYCPVNVHSLNITGDGQAAHNFTVNNILSVTTTLCVPGIAIFGGGTGSVSTPTGYSMYVKSGILTEKLKVANSSDPTNWSDFVFDRKYKLMSLKNLESFIVTNKHLPEIPTASEVAKDGIDVANMDALLLQKIEELTLYVIQQQKEIEDLKKAIRQKSH